MSRIDRILEKANRHLDERHATPQPPAITPPPPAQQPSTPALPTASEADYRALSTFESIPVGHFSRERMAVENGAAIARARAHRDAVSNAAHQSMLTATAAQQEQARAAAAEQQARAAAAQQAENAQAEALLGLHISAEERRVLDQYARLRAEGKFIAAAGLHAQHSQLISRAAEIVATARRR